MVREIFFVTDQKNERLFGMLGAYIERVEVLDQAFSSIKSADNIESVEKVADTLNRYNNKMKELVITDKEVKGEIMEIKGLITKEKKEMMKQMTVNAGLIHKAEIQDRYVKDSLEGAQNKIQFLEEKIAEEKSFQQIMRDPISDIFTQCLEYGLHQTTIEASLLDSLKDQDISNQEMLGFTEVVVKKLLGYKEENVEDEDDEGERVDAFLTGVDHTANGNDKKSRMSMIPKNSFEHIIAKEQDNLKSNQDTRLASTTVGDRKLTFSNIVRKIIF